MNAIAEGDTVSVCAVNGIYRVDHIRHGWAQTHRIDDPATTPRAFFISRLTKVDNT